MVASRFYASHMAISLLFPRRKVLASLAFFNLKLHFLSEHYNAATPRYYNNVASNIARSADVGWHCNGREATYSLYPILGAQKNVRRPYDDCAAALRCLVNCMANPRWFCGIRKFAMRCVKHRMEAEQSSYGYCKMSWHPRQSENSRSPHGSRKATIKPPHSDLTMLWTCGALKVPLWQPHGTLTVPTRSHCSHLIEFDLINYTFIMWSPLLSWPLLPQAVRLFDFKRSYLETVDHRIIRIRRPYSGSMVCDRAISMVVFRWNVRRRNVKKQPGLHSEQVFNMQIIWNYQTSICFRQENADFASRHYVGSRAFIRYIVRHLLINLVKSRGREVWVGSDPIALNLTSVSGVVLLMYLWNIRAMLS